jgi:hypothetical protein
MRRRVWGESCFAGGNAAGMRFNNQWRDDSKVGIKTDKQVEELHMWFAINDTVPYKESLNRLWWDISMSCLSYHVPHQSQVNTQSSRLPPCTLSLLENPLTFFTNTRHPSQCYHLSFSTKKDCIFPCNTIVNIDVAPRLPVCHIIT